MNVQSLANELQMHFEPFIDRLFGPLSTYRVANGNASSAKRIDRIQIWAVHGTSNIDSSFTFNDQKKYLSHQ
jgi:hypothetical protein